MKIKLINENAVIPTYGSEYSAGMDLYACLNEPATVLPGETVFIPTGLAMEIPTGCVGLVYARSGLACKRGLAPANKVGVIDSDYRGEIMVALYNHSNEPQIVNIHDRVAQMVIAPYIKMLSFDVVDELGETERGAGGFGHTGV